jgi:hypothetical protein
VVDKRVHRERERERVSQFNSINPCRHFIRVLLEYPFYSLQRRLINALSGRWWHGHTLVLYTTCVWQITRAPIHIYICTQNIWRGEENLFSCIAHSLWRAVKNLRNQSNWHDGARVVVGVYKDFNDARTSGRPATPESLVSRYTRE